MNLVLILGNQLFDPKIFAKKNIDKEKTQFFMREDEELASYYRFHKHKIIFFFASMRTYRDELRALGYKVHYEEFNKTKDGTTKRAYEKSLAHFIQKNKIKNAFTFEIEDKFFEDRILKLFNKNSLALNIWQSPMFLTSRPDFKNQLVAKKRPFMKTFYEWQRKRLKLLVEKGKPVGGSWSFDTENRLALPKNLKTPELPSYKPNQHLDEMIKLVDKEFPHHPGRGIDFWLPVDRAQAKKWLQCFLKDRLFNFGPFEDAIPPHSDFVFHSVLTPFLNSGLLTPNEVVSEALKWSEQQEIPIASLEGFVRQIIGWREFIRGIYQNYSEKQESENFWQHKNQLSSAWYQGETGIPPLDTAIKRILKRGYAHHIERLMVIGNLMLLLEVEPKAAYRWFMEMFIDSSDWVMGPNVYGMALFSDGGIFATKPYICGSNYWRKMGGYPKGDWCDGVDGLYWQFIKKHENFFLKNPRLSMMAKTAQKISPARWEILERSAQALRKKLVQPA